MKALSAGIFTKFTGSAFSTSIGGRLYKGRAPQGVVWPYAVYFVVDDSPADTFTDSIEDVLVQFSLFSSASGTTEIEDIFTSLKALFDNSSFTVTGNTLIEMERQSASLTSIDADTEAGTGEYWMYVVEYRVTMQKN